MYKLYTTYLSYLKMGGLGIFIALVSVCLYAAISSNFAVQLTATILLTALVVANTLVVLGALLKWRRRLSSHAYIASAIFYLAAFVATILNCINGVLPDNQRVIVERANSTGRLRHAIWTH